MHVEIYIRERKGSREIRVPWLPEKINYKSGGIVKASYDIMGKGPVEVHTGTGLSEFSWESVFPGKYRTDTSMLRGSWQSPFTYHSILEDWRQKGTPLVLLVVGYPIHKNVILDDYNGNPAGGFGDIEYDLNFIEDRDIVIQPSKDKTSAPAPKERAATKTTSYTIKKGDNLWKISKNILGEGSKWKTIYDANKDIIEKTAKKYGKKSSDNGHWIYPGVTLTIPQ